MPTGIIELNDAGIRAGYDGEVKITSPGYAVLDGRSLFIGTEGQARSRLLPRWTNNRFWNQLGTDPLPQGTDLVRHHADLAFAHLEQVWQEINEADRVVLVVPGFYTREQLGLLLGMARECGIPVAGVVDASLVSVSGAAARPTILHLDIFLHRITLTVLTADSFIRRTQILSIAETGLFTLWDRWANIIAAQFIQTSRYDPMHQASSEQKLYDALPGWITALARNTSFELETDSSRKQVPISTDQLLAACAGLYPQIIQRCRDHIPAGERASLLVSHRFAGFPGLDDSLRLITQADLQYLDADAAFSGVIANLDAIVSESGPVSHITSLQNTGQISQPAPTTGSTQPGPTHVLDGHRGMQIGQVLKLGVDEAGNVIRTTNDPVATLYLRGKDTLLECHNPQRVLLNGEPAAARSTLYAGNVLEINGHALTLITVE